jgi:hypothetical protein
MNRKNEAQSLSLQTLSGTYESSRSVCRLIKVDIASTYDRLALNLKSLCHPKNRQQLVELHQALNALDDHSTALGTTTLVAPLDHPLVVRHEAVLIRSRK